LDKNALRRFLKAALHPPVKDDTAREAAPHRRLGL
jgi:hypothetical protein